MKIQEAKRILGDTQLCSPLGQAAFVAIEALDLLQKQKDGLVVELPAPIGHDVFIAGSFEEIDGFTVYYVEQTKLAGFINKDGREFYLCYDEDFGSIDVDPGSLFKTQEAAETARKAMEGKDNGKTIGETS